MIIKSQTQFCFPVTQLQKKNQYFQQTSALSSSPPQESMALLGLLRGGSKGRAASPLLCAGGSSWATVGPLWARGRNPDQVSGDQNQFQPAGIYLGSWQEPPPAQVLGRWLPWSHCGKNSSLCTPYRPQCPGLCKASTNFSMWFARVQTARLDLTDVQFHVMMYFMHSISVGPECWEVPSDSRASHFALLQAQILSSFIPTIKPYHQESWGGRNGSRIWV